MYREKGENNRKNRSFWWVLGLVWTEGNSRRSKNHCVLLQIPILFLDAKIYPAVFIWVHILTSLYAFTTTTFLIIECLCYLYASILTARVYTTYIILELDNIKHALIFIRLHCLYLHMLENWKRENLLALVGIFPAIFCVVQSCSYV